MLLQFFIQGDQNNEWWYVTDKTEHDAMKTIFSFYTSDKKSYRKPNTIEKMEYQVTTNNNTIEYVLELKWIVPEYFGQGMSMEYELYRYRKVDPHKKRKVIVVELPNHNGFSTL